MLTLTLPWPSADLSPNGGVGRWDAIRAAKAAKNAAWGYTKAAMQPLGIAYRSWSGPVDVLYTFHAMQERGRDDDNFIRRMKPARDGIALALGIDDKTFRLLPVIWGGKRNGTVEVTLTPSEVSIPHRGTIT